MALQLDISEAKPRLSELVARANAGEEIVFFEAGKPVARLIPAEQNSRALVLGMFKDQAWISDDFNAPLADDELKEWGL